MDARPELDPGLAAFLGRLAAEEPAPGGGSAAAVAVGMAAALASSVASLSRRTWPEAGGAMAQAQAIARRVGPLIEGDARAYDEALAAITGRAEIPAAEREGRLADTLERAAEVPLEIAEAAADAAEVAALAVEHGDAGVRADAVAAAMLAEAAAQVARTLIEINLGTRRGDQRLATAEALVARAQAGRERAVGALTG